MNTLSRFPSGSSAFSPARDFGLLRREVDRLFGDALGTRSADEDEQFVWAPRADLAETEDAFVLSIDVPGVHRDALQITMEDDSITVSGQREAHREQRDSRFHRVERTYGRFFRQFTFGVPVDPERVEAEVEDGVLTLRVPKAEASKPRRIEVRSSRALSSGGDGATGTPEPVAQPSETHAQPDENRS